MGAPCRGGGGGGGFPEQLVAAASWVCSSLFEIACPKPVLNSIGTSQQLTVYLGMYAPACPAIATDQFKMMSRPQKGKPFCKLTCSCTRSYKLPVIITRGNNVYGPHQFPEKMIPKFTLLASRGEPLPVHGDGEQLQQPHLAIAWRLL